jgi:hypothetical protein
MEARDSDFDAAVKKMLGGDQGKAAILSWTFGRQRKDLKPNAVSGFTGLLKRLHEKGVMSEGAAATEKGGRHHWFHVQGMFRCPKLSNSRDEVQEACAQLVYNHGGIPTGQNYHVHVELHWPDEQRHISWRTMVGYDPVPPQYSRTCAPVDGFQATTCADMQLRDEGQWM